MSEKNDNKVPNVPNLRFNKSEVWHTERLSKYAKKITLKNKNNLIENIICNSAQNGLIQQKDFFDRTIVNNENTEHYYVIEQGNFVYNPRKSVTAPYGPVNVYEYTNSGIVSPLYLCFKVDGIDKRFLNYYFKSSAWYKYIYENGDSGARHDRVSIKDDVFLAQPIIVPHLTTQDKIASFLSKIDQRIETQSKIINCLESLLNEISHHYFGSLSSIEIALSKIADIYQPKTISQSECSENGTYNVFGANGIIGKFNQYNHDLPQICITCRGSTSGNVFMTESYSWITGNAMVINIDKNLEIVNKTFLYYYLSSMSFKNIISGSGQPQIVREPLMKIKIKLPSLEEQLRFEKIINSIASKLQKEKDILALYKKQKAYLLANMFI